MTVLMFPDNTVLINFAIINRMDLLGRLANGNGRWCATVAIECAESARRPELAVLGGAEEIFGQPLFPDQAELQDIRVLRDRLASPGDRPTQHLGEAETIAIIVRRKLSCFFVSDDRGAARLAVQNGVQVVGTWHLLKVAHRKGWMDADTFWGYVLTLEGQGRGAPAGVWDRSSFDKWRSALRVTDHGQWPIGLPGSSAPTASKSRSSGSRTANDGAVALRGQKVILRPEGS